MFFHPSHSVCIWNYLYLLQWHEDRIVRWLGSSGAEGFSVQWWWCKEENWYLLVYFWSHNTKEAVCWFLFSFLIQSFCIAIVLSSSWLIYSYCAVNEICFLKTAVISTKYKCQIIAQEIPALASFFLLLCHVPCFIYRFCYFLGTTGTVSFSWTMWKCNFHS